MAPSNTPASWPPSEAAIQGPIPSRGVGTRSESKLFCEHALFQSVVAVEHHEKLDGARLLDLDLHDIARLEMIGDGADGTLFGFENLDRYVDPIRHERSTPAARAERADRRNGEERRLDRQNGPVRGKIVSRRSGRRCNENAVANQFL